MNKAKIETLYLSYLNDYLTIPVFAEAQLKIKEWTHG